MPDNCKGNMTKSLHKALAILETVFGKDGRSVTPSEAAAKVGITLATCSRIMSDLQTAGYLDRMSRRSGYVGGPMIFSLAGRKNAYRTIVEGSRQAIRDLSVKMSVTVNLAILQQGHRRILLSETPAGETPLPLCSFYEEFYNSATARLLLSKIAPAERMSIVKKFGKNRQDRTTMLAIANELHNRHETVFRHSVTGVWAVGSLIELPNLPAFAFGFGVPQDLKSAALEASRQTAACIKAVIQPKTTHAY